MIFLPLLLQAAAQTPPDIQLNVDIHADRVRIERRGEARLDVSASPDAGSEVHVDAPPANGRRTLRNVDVRVRAEARIAAPEQNREPAETASPQ